MKTLNMILAVFTMWTIYASYRVIKYVDSHEQSIKAVTAQIDKQKFVVDSMTRVVDSVNNKLLTITIDKQRYEVALSNLKDNNPEVAEKFEYVLSNME